MHSRRPRCVGRPRVAATTLLVAATFVVSLCRPSVAARAATSLTFVPTADAYVASNAPSTNFGTGPTLQVGSSPSTHSYLLFDVQGISGSVSSAKLSLYTDSSGSGSSVHAAGTAWTETGITYSSAPSYGATVATVSKFPVGTWIVYDVTSLVTGNGVVAFAYTSASSTPISFASREDAAHAPQLVITASGGAATVPGAPANVVASAGDGQAAVAWAAPGSDGGSPISSYTATSAPGGLSCTTSTLGCTVSGLTNGTSYTFTVTATNGVGTGPPSAPSAAVTPTGAAGGGPLTLLPMADAYVSGGAKTTNYGTSTSLEVGSSPSLHTYLMFDLQGLGGPPTKAMLMLWTSSAGSGCSIHGTGTAWTETGITYSTAPSYGSTVKTVTNFAAGTWIGYDVTSLVTGNGPVAFALTSASKTPILFASREDAAHAPQLIITP